MRHIIPISGKDSLATALVQMAHEPERDYEFFTNVVGKELPPFYDWINQVGGELGKKITLVGENLAEIISEKGILPSPRVRFCTREAKIRPMEQWIGQDTATIYYGLRADEMAREGYRDNERLQARYPLREHGIDLLGVWTILEYKNLLPPPFLFPEVVEGVKQKMGRDFVITERLKPWHYNMLFSGRTRQFNCYDCFYMRRYEFTYLYLYWPAQFWQAVQMEESTGADGFSIVPGIPLRSFADNPQDYIKRRIAKVAKTLYKLAQTSTFDELPDELGMTSCGMFCGK